MTNQMSDDILIHAPDETTYDQALEAVFKQLSDCGLTLNKSKCEFYGYIFSAEGVSPDPRKVASLKEASVRKTAQKVKSFLEISSAIIMSSKC